MSATKRFNVGVTGILLGLAAAAWYVAASGIVGMGAMDISVPLYLATWLVMLVAMMFPAVAPIVLTFARVASAHADGGLVVAGFVLGYLIVWMAAGVVPLFLYLGSQGLIAGMFATTLGSFAIGAVLLAAGIYQFSPWKSICLRACRSPLGFVLNHDFGGGWRRAFRAGASHGAFCLGCCWALMSVLVVVGLMNLAWMAALSVLFLAEKNWRYGAGLSRFAGGTFALAGLLVVAGQALL
jgi:predicted metal-binding membrane protein